MAEAQSNKGSLEQAFHRHATTNKYGDRNVFDGIMLIHAIILNLPADGFVAMRHHLGVAGQAKEN